MASTCALLLDLGRLEVGSRLTMNQGLQLRSSTSAAIRPARGSSEEVPQPPSAADPARGAQMAVKGPRGAQERSGADRLTKRWDPLRGSAVREELAAKGQRVVDDVSLSRLRTQTSQGSSSSGLQALHQLADARAPATSRRDTRLTEAKRPRTRQTHGDAYATEVNRVRRLRTRAFSTQRRGEQQWRRGTRR